MKLIPNEKGKIVLVNQDGENVFFDYAVDANEALNMKDENGASRYTLPGVIPKTKDFAPEKKVEFFDESKRITKKSKKEKEEVEIAAVQVCIWSSTDQIRLKKRIKRLMKKAGFAFMGANDNLETDTKIFMNAARFMAAEEAEQEDEEE